MVIVGTTAGLPVDSADLMLSLAVCEAIRMGNSSSDRSSGSHGERSYREGHHGGKEARSNIMMDSADDADLYQREDQKVLEQVYTMNS